MTIAVLAAAALIAVGVVWLIATGAQLQLRRQPTERHEVPYAAPQHSESRD